MHLVALRRSLVAAAAMTLLTIPSAFADTVVADHDIVTSGAQNVVDLGTAEPGADIPVDVFFTLSCSGTSHVNPTQAVKLTPATHTVPADGGYSVGTLVFGLGGDWPADGQECPAGIQPTIGGPLRMIVTAPTTPGDDYGYFFSWTPSVTPPSASDSGVFEGDRPSISFIVDVAGQGEPTNSPPTLNLPTNSTVEGDTAGGAIAAYTVTAGDAEDGVAPTPSCSPVVGSVLPLGANAVTCSATDSGGLVTTGSFTITVVDTTAPALATHGDIDVTTTDPTGVVVDFGYPSYFELVDPSPVAACDWPVGAKFPVGSTTVTCTVTDASGNTGTLTFAVRVRLGQVIFEDPVGASAGVVVNGSRTVPVKAGIVVGGRPVTSGNVILTVQPCAGGASVDTETLALQSNGRWIGHLSTDGLAAGCYRVMVSVDGLAVGGFQLDVRGDTSLTSSKPAKPTTASTTALSHPKVSVPPKPAKPLKPTGRH